MRGAAEGRERSGALQAGLREEIAAKLRRDNAVDADPRQIIVTVGAVEAIAARDARCL